MVRIGKFSSIQSSNVELPANTEAKPQISADSANAHTSQIPAAASSENTWQRANLIQDGRIQQSLLSDQLTVQKSYTNVAKEVEQNKEAREQKSLASLLGTIFGGPIIGTAIGNAIGTEVSHPEQNPIRDLLGTFEEEAKKISEQLDKVYDEAFLETAGGSSPISDLRSRVSTKVSYDGDDD
jgi:hypothetical protein